MLGSVKNHVTRGCQMIYRINLKNRFLTRRPRKFVFWNERSLCKHKARVPKHKFAAKPTQSKTDFLSYFGIIRNVLFLLFALSALHLQGFEKVIIWGHKLHSHTHSYIHNGFYHA